ncbi:ribonuclease H-like domain-containing protein, partial [Tanacetum coccineum]
ILYSVFGRDYPSKDSLNWYADNIDQDEEEIDDDDETDEQDDEIDKEVEDGKDDFDDELWSLEKGANIPTDGPATVEMVNATKDNFDDDDLVKFQELLLDVENPLYEGYSDFTKLSAIVKLLNMKGKYGCSDKFFTELLGLLKKMLPADEKFPKIAEDPRNLLLGILADGVDVNTGNRHNSVWPVLTIIYNLPS